MTSHDTNRNTKRRINKIERRAAGPRWLSTAAGFHKLQERSTRLLQSFATSCCKTFSMQAWLICMLLLAGAISSTTAFPITISTGTKWTATCSDGTQRSGSESFVGNLDAPVGSRCTFSVEYVVTEGSAPAIVEAPMSASGRSDGKPPGEAAANKGEVKVQPTSGARDACRYSSDGACDDGGPGAEFTLCSLGSDLADCSHRQFGTAVSVRAQIARSGNDRLRFCRTARAPICWTPFLLLRPNRDWRCQTARPPQQRACAQWPHLRVLYLAARVAAYGQAVPSRTTSRLLRLPLLLRRCRRRPSV